MSAATTTVASALPATRAGRPAPFTRTADRLYAVGDEALTGGAEPALTINPAATQSALIAVALSRATYVRELLALAANATCRGLQLEEDALLAVHGQADEVTILLQELQRRDLDSRQGTFNTDDGRPT